MSELEPITSDFWQEIAHPKDPFLANRMLCRGYDVFQQMLGRADLTDYLCLLLFGDKPTPRQKALINHLAIILGNPGPRDPSVRAAMTAAAGGSSPVSCLIAALACGSGNLGGSHEIQLIVDNMYQHERSINSWQGYLEQDFPIVSSLDQDVYTSIEHPPGFFDAHETSSDTVHQALASLSEIEDTHQLRWVKENFTPLTQAARCGMQMSFVAGAAFYDLKMTAEQSEFVYLLLRLPGALAHALEQRARGWRDYPFHAGGVHFKRQQGDLNDE